MATGTEKHGGIEVFIHHYESQNQDGYAVSLPAVPTVGMILYEAEKYQRVRHVWMKSTPDGMYSLRVVLEDLKDWSKEGLPLVKI